MKTLSSYIFEARGVRWNHSKDPVVKVFAEVIDGMCYHYCGNTRWSDMADVNTAVSVFSAALNKLGVTANVKKVKFTDHTKRSSAPGPVNFIHTWEIEIKVSDKGKIKKVNVTGHHSWGGTGRYEYDGEIMLCAFDDWGMPNLEVYEPVFDKFLKDLGVR